jgi:hypothetical protein
MMMMVTAVMMSIPRECSNGSISSSETRFSLVTLCPRKLGLLFAVCNRLRLLETGVPMLVVMMMVMMVMVMMKVMMMTTTVIMMVMMLDVMI